MTGSLSQTRGRPEPGRELDALVAEKVMGLRRPLPGEYDWGEHEWYAVEGAVPATLPRYSTDIAAAWTVVEKIEAFGGGGIFCPSVSSDGDGLWHVQFYAWGASEAIQPPVCSAPTPAHAICLAALAAVAIPRTDDGGRE